jgi:hypothetical protein
MALVKPKTHPTISLCVNCRGTGKASSARLHVSSVHSAPRLMCGASSDTPPICGVDAVYLVDYDEHETKLGALSEALGAMRSATLAEYSPCLGCLRNLEISVKSLSKPASANRRRARRVQVVPDAPRIPDPREVKANLRLARELAKKPTKRSRAVK